MHFDLSIACGCLSSPEIAPAGHFFAHNVQPLHFAASILYWISFEHLPARHFLSLMCSMYSSMKYLSVDRTGLEAVWPRPQSEALFIASQIACMSTMSCSVPRPSVILLR